jgi:hypothetical protein
MLLNPLLTAWTGALLFRTGRRLGWSRPLSISTALIFGLLTMAWPYAQSYLQRPGRRLGTLRRRVRAAGLRAIGAKALPLRQRAGVGHRLSHAHDQLDDAADLRGRAVAGVDAALYAAWAPTSPPAFAARSGATGVRSSTFAIPVVAMGLLSLWWNWARFGNIWDTGYVETETFSADWFFGLFGLTVGPARGVLWYNPILVLAIPGALWFWRRQRRILFLALALITRLFCRLRQVVYVARRLQLGRALHRADAALPDAAGRARLETR